MRYEMLQDTEKRKALEIVNRYFDKTHIYKTQFKHSIFKDRFPFEYHNTPIGDLQGNAKQLNEYLFEQSQKWIKPTYDLLLEHIALKLLARRKSLNHSTFRKFIKSTR